MNMGCEGYREALSARLDGEDEPSERASTTAHLASCAGCRAWFEQAAAVTRLTRTGLATLSPGVSDSVLAAAPGRGWARLRAGLRLGLGLIGGLQLLVGVAQAAALGGFCGLGGPAGTGGTTLDGAGPDHLVHESAAWNIALGAGFVFVAWRRTRPAGILPILTAFVGVLTLLSAADLADGQVDLARLGSHALIIAGYLLVLVLSRPSMGLDDPPAHRQHGTGTRRWRLDAAEAPVPDLRVVQRLTGVPPVVASQHDQAA